VGRSPIRHYPYRCFVQRAALLSEEGAPWKNFNSPAPPLPFLLLAHLWSFMRTIALEREAHFEGLRSGATLLRHLSINVSSWRYQRNRGNRPMTENALFLGKIGWFVALAIIGLAIWYFKVHRKPPHSN
jgi:hypothetical protein